MVEVTVNRYQGDKRLSSLPYTLAVSPGSQRSTLRVGGQVPIPSTTFTPVKEPDGKTTPLTSFQYRDIGTNIDVTAEVLTDGRYRLLVTLEETSVYSPNEAAKNAAVLVSTAPAFRSLRTSNYLTLKDGQSIEFTAATDRINGETARLSVKLTVVN